MFNQAYEQMDNKTRSAPFLATKLTEEVGLEFHFTSVVFALSLPSQYCDELRFLLHLNPLCFRTSARCLLAPAEVVAPERVF